MSGRYDRLLEIGIALGRICRFGGRSTQFYPVLPHSLAVGTLVQMRAPGLAIYGYLHDAAEIYCGDIPLGRKLTDQKWAEEIELKEMLLKLDLPWPTEPDWRVVRQVDRVVGDAEWLILGPRDEPPRHEPLEDFEAMALTRELAVHSYHYWLTAELGPKKFALSCTSCLWPGFSRETQHAGDSNGGRI